MDVLIEQLKEGGIGKRTGTLEEEFTVVRRYSLVYLRMYMSTYIRTCSGREEF